MAAPDGVQIAVHELGGGGPPLLLVHATGFHGRVWQPVADGLATGFHCVAPDLRGHGDSTPASGLDFDWRGFAVDLLTVVDELGLESPFGVGHSSGATALLLAEQSRPGTFRGLYCFEPILVPADPPLGRDHDSWLAAATRRRRAAFPSRADALRHFASKRPLSTLDPAALRAYVEHGFEEVAGGGVRLKCSPEHEALVYEMATAHDCFVRLAEIRCSVTLVRGGRSEAYSPGLFEELAGRLHSSWSEVLAELSHLGPMEDADAVAGSVWRAFAPRDEPPRSSGLGAQAPDG